MEILLRDGNVCNEKKYRMLCGLNGDTTALEDLEKSLKVFEVMGWSTEGKEYNSDFLSFTAGYFGKYASDVLNRKYNNPKTRKQQ